MEEGITSRRRDAKARTMTNDGMPNDERTSQCRKRSREGNSYQNFHHGRLAFFVATPGAAGAPAGMVGSLIVGAALGLGGMLIRTVSFFG